MVYKKLNVANSKQHWKLQDCPYCGAFCQRKVIEGVLSSVHLMSYADGTVHAECGHCHARGPRFRGKGRFRKARKAWCLPFRRSGESDPCCYNWF